MRKLDEYRKAIAQYGLLAHAITPSPGTPPLSEKDRTEANSRFFLENLKQRIEEDTDLRAAVERLLKKKRGPKTKWGLLERAALISEVRSHLPRRSSESMTDKTSITAICKALAGQTHWSKFLGAVENGGETLRQRYTEDCRDLSLLKLARFISESKDSQGGETRTGFVRKILRVPDEQQSGQTLDQIMNRMVRKTG